MAKHIGIVAVSYEGAALCYQSICAEAATVMGEHRHPEITMHTFPLADYMPFASRQDWEGVAGLLLKSAEKVARAGADFAVCPANTAHQAFRFMGRRSPIPWLHIVEVVAEEAAARGEDAAPPLHWLLALLCDAEDPVEVTAHRYPVERRKRAMFGLPDRGPSPVRLLVESHGLTLEQLRAAVLEELDQVQ